MKSSKKCVNCNKTIPALSTYIRTNRPVAGAECFNYCSISCLMAFTHTEIVDPKMETPNVPA